MGIHDDDVAAVRAASDIVAIVSQTTQLRKVGAQWVGRCPFHSDNSPSFSVNANTNVYYCFGCGVYGDVINYVQEREGLGFPEAVEWLAAKANISLRYTDRQQGENRRRRDRLTEVMGRAVDWYHERLLTGADAGAARSYLRGRGLDGDVVREFKLGWAPDSWDEACKALKLDEKTARDTGLGKRNSRGRLQDHFRGRILFPIADDQGRPIGFGGRILPGGERPGNQGKYQNTAETPLYTKSRVLYGLDRAKKPIVADDTVVVCEGYTDVIAFHRNGVPLAVASCGTSLTDDHVKLLRRFARRFVLAFDADSAGQAAAERFYRWEQDHDLEVAVADLPPGQDPGDLAQSDPPRLAAAVEGARPFLRFRLDRMFAAADLSSPEGRARAAQQALDLVAEHPNVFVRDQYLVDVAGRCRIEPDRLRSQFEEHLRTRRRETGSGGRPGPSRGRPGPAGRERDSRRPAGPPPRGRPRPGSPPGPAEGGAWGNEGRAVANEPMEDAPPPWAGESTPARPAPGPARITGPLRDGPMVEVLRHAVHNPAEVGPWLAEAVFDDPRHVALYRLLVESDTTEAARAAAPPEVAALLGRLLVEPPAEEPFKAVRRAYGEVIQRELHTLNADRADDPREVVAQTVELRSMLKDLHAGDPDAATEAAGRLLAWLRNGVETGDD